MSIQENRETFNTSSIAAKIEILDHIVHFLSYLKDHRCMWKLEDIESFIYICNFLGLKASNNPHYLFDPENYYNPWCPYPLILFEKALTLRSFKEIADDLNMSVFRAVDKMTNYIDVVFYKVRTLQLGYTKCKKRTVKAAFYKKRIAGATWTYYEKLELPDIRILK